MSGERGFALLAVMLVLALLGVVAGEFAFAMRLEATMVRSYRDEVVSRHLVDAAVQQAILEILSDAPLVGLKDGALTFFLSPSQPLPRLPRTEVALGRGQFAYQITDEGGRLNLNTASPDRVDRLLLTLGVDKQLRDTINDSLQDWKDPNDLSRLNGAESEDTYLKLPVPYRARNAALQDAAELLQIKGVTPALYFGSADQLGLAELVTVRGSGQVNINTAPEPVLKALGLSDAEVSEIVQARQIAPYSTVPARFTARGFSAGSRTFRIEATGWIGGEVRARALAIVQKTGAAGTGRRAPRSAARPAGPIAQQPAAPATGQPAFLILSWNPNQPAMR